MYMYDTYTLQHALPPLLNFLTPHGGYIVQVYITHITYHLSPQQWGQTPVYTASHLMVDSSVQLGLIYSYHIPLVSSSDQQRGQTPVNIASESGHGTVVQMLIEAKADINHPDKV